MTPPIDTIYKIEKIKAIDRIYMINRIEAKTAKDLSV